MKGRLSTSTVSSVDLLESQDGYFGKIVKRYGHPSLYKTDGYDLGVRYKVRGMLQSHFVACSRLTGEKVTIKEFHVPLYPAGQDQSVATEVLFLSKLAHPCLPRFKEVFLAVNKTVYLVTESVEMTRLSQPHVVSQLTFADCQRAARSLLEALAFLHARRIVVRDLTPANIAVKRVPLPPSSSSSLSSSHYHRDTPPSSSSSSPSSSAAAGTTVQVCIADLSFAVELQPHHRHHPVLAEHPLFEWPLVFYSAPEALRPPADDYGPPVDLWALGCLLCPMLTRGQLTAFDAGSNNSNSSRADHLLLQQIFAGDYRDEAEAWEDVPDEAQRLVRELISPNPVDRPTAKEALTRPWLLAAERSTTEE